MSKSQLKKAIAELRVYLHKDARGIELLEDVAIAAHAVRTTASADASRAEAAEKRCEGLRQEADRLRQIDARRSVEMEACEARAKAADMRERAAVRELEEERERTHIPMTEWDLGKDLTADRLYRWARKTGRQLGALPKPTRCQAPRVYGHQLTDVWTSIDERGFAAIGRVVVIECLMWGASMMYWPDTVADQVEMRDAIFAGDRNDKALRMVMAVFRKCVDGRSRDERLKDMTSGKCRWGQEKDDDVGTANKLFDMLDGD